MLNKMIEILLAAILLIPVFCLLNRARFHSLKKTGLYFLFATYLAAVWLFVGLPTAQFMRFEVSLTLMPFLPMIADAKNTVLNILLFVPLGILLPLLWRQYRAWKTAVGFGLGMSAAIELLQMFTYRATDINDVIANTLGAALGYGIFRAASRLIPPVAKLAERKNEVFVPILSTAIVMFFMHPWLAEIWYRIT